MEKAFLTLLIFTLGLCSNAQTDTKIDWISDLRYLQQELPKNHYDLFFQLSEHDFNRGIDKLIQTFRSGSDLYDEQAYLKHLKEDGIPQLSATNCQDW